jgi:hypothetical protein
MSFEVNSNSKLKIQNSLLRFYNEQDFTFLGLIANPRVWSNLW